MVQRIIIVIAILFACELRAAQTLIKRSMFVPPAYDNVCDLSATNLSGFDSVVTATTWPVIAVGATTNGQGGLGWSGWMQKTGNTNSARFTNLVINTYYQGSCWMRLHQFSTAVGSESPNTDASSGAARFLTVGRAGDLGSMSFGVAGAGSLWLANASGATTNIASLSINTWYYFAVSWRTTNSGSVVKDGRIYLATLGASPTNIYSFDGVTAFAALSWIDFGNLTAGGGLLSGQITGCSVHTLSAGFGDSGIPTDINPPVEARQSWYINPATGSDLNSGAYSTNAFQTAFRMWKLLRFGGARGGGLIPWVYTAGGAAATPGSNPWAWNRGVMDGSIHATGDKILLDTSSAPLRTTNCIKTMTNNVGIEIGSANSTQAVIKPWTILSGTWTQYDSINFPNIWQIANANGQSNVVMWEDEKWLNNPTNSSGLVNLTTNLNSTAGSFWSDTTNFYVHPFGSTNPNSDGKTYERGQWLYDASASTVLSKYNTMELFDNGTYINNLKVYGQVYRDQYAGTWDANYVIRLANNGPSVIGESNLRYGGKHVYGGVSGSATLYRFNFNSVFEQGPPWTDITGTSGVGNEVEFPSSGTGTRQAYFWHCDAATNSVIGSTAGDTSARDGFFSHQSSGPVLAYLTIHYFNCKGSFLNADGMFPPGGIIVSNCIANKIGLSTVGGTNVLNPLIVRTYLDGPLFGLGGGTMQDCVMNRTDDISQNLLHAGAWTFNGVTFDGRSVTNTTSNLALIRSDATLRATNTFSNCVFLLPQSAADITFMFYKTNDVLTFNNNVWSLNAQGHNMNFNGAETTWVQWQALSQDAASNTNNPAINASYRPYAKTPTWNVATDRGASIDYTGKLFQSRRTAGAYEYDPPTITLFK